jgi:hypothetical protein
MGRQDSQNPGIAVLQDTFLRLNLESVPLNAHPRFLNAVQHL